MSNQIRLYAYVAYFERVEKKKRRKKAAFAEIRSFPQLDNLQVKRSKISNSRDVQSHQQLGWDLTSLQGMKVNIHTYPSGLFLQPQTLFQAKNLAVNVEILHKYG